MTKKQRQEAIDAGRDYAADYISWNPGKDMYDIESELQGCAVDMGGTDVERDYIYEGMCQVVRERKGTKR